MDKYLRSILYHSKSVTFKNEGTFTLTSSVQDLPVMIKWHNFQSFEKALNFLRNLIVYEQYLLSKQAQKCVGGHL